jgi:hypothetical protein
MPYANLERMEIKDLAELLGGKAGRNSLPLKNFPGEIFLTLGDANIT